MTPNLNISARMSWSISEILKPFKKLAVVYYQVKNISASPWVFKPDNTLLLVFINITYCTLHKHILWLDFIFVFFSNFSLFQPQYHTLLYIKMYKMIKTDTDLYVFWTKISVKLIWNCCCWLYESISILAIFRHMACWTSHGLLPDPKFSLWNVHLRRWVKAAPGNHGNRLNSFKNNKDEMVS